MNNYLAPFKSYKTYILLAFFITLYFVLDRYAAFQSENIKIGFKFLAVIAGAYVGGPIGGMLVGGCGDFFGAVIMPKGGGILFGITLCEILSGFVYGLFLFRNKKILNIYLSVIIVEVFIDWLLKTYFLSQAGFGPVYPVNLIARSMQAGILIVGQIAIIIPFLGSISKAYKE